MVTGKPDAVFRALADPTRRRILGLLRERSRPVGDIAGKFRVSRPAISKHLRLLREARLVIERRDGRQRICELDPRPLRALDDWLKDYRLFSAGSLQRLKRYAESAERKESWKTKS